MRVFIVRGRLSYVLDWEGPILKRPNVDRCQCGGGCCADAGDRAHAVAAHEHDRERGPVPRHPRRQQRARRLHHVHEGNHPPLMQKLLALSSRISTPRHGLLVPCFSLLLLFMFLNTQVSERHQFFTRSLVLPPLVRPAGMFIYASPS